MPIFKLTDPCAEVTYTLWCFDVDAFLEQYDEASMHPHIFASLRRYPGKWARTLDISMQDLLMHMEKTFGNKRYYSAMIRTLYEVQQKEDEMVEEYMLHIHNVVVVIHCTYPERLPDHGRDLKTASTMDYTPTFMMPLALRWQNYPKGNRLTLCLIHCKPLQRSWRLGSQCGHAVMPPAWMFIERSTDATLR